MFWYTVPLSDINYNEYPLFIYCIYWIPAQHVLSGSWYTVPLGSILTMNSNYISMVSIGFLLIHCPFRPVFLLWMVCIQSLNIYLLDTWSACTQWILVHCPFRQYSYYEWYVSSPWISIGYLLSMYPVDPSLLNKNVSFRDLYHCINVIQMHLLHLKII